jgi:hypothetical protein
MNSHALSTQTTSDQQSSDSPRLLQHLAKALHPSWRAFIEYCLEMGHGEIENLKIQDGLPVLAEVTRRKVKFVR